MTSGDGLAKFVSKPTGKLNDVAKLLGDDDFTESTLKDRYVFEHITHL